MAPVGSPGDHVKIHQDAWCSIAELSQGHSLEYQMKSESKGPRGVYVFVIEGRVSINSGEESAKLDRRDATGLVMPRAIRVAANETAARVLFIEVPSASPTEWK